MYICICMYIYVHMYIYICVRKSGRTLTSFNSWRAPVWNWVMMPRKVDVDVSPLSFFCSFAFVSCTCACVRTGVRVCVCVRERQQERDRETERERQRERERERGKGWSGGEGEGERGPGPFQYQWGSERVQCSTVAAGATRPWVLCRKPDWPAQSTHLYHHAMYSSLSATNWCISAMYSCKSAIYFCISARSFESKVIRERCRQFDLAAQMYMYTCTSVVNS